MENDNATMRKLSHSLHGRHFPHKHTQTHTCIHTHTHADSHGQQPLALVNGRGHLQDSCSWVHTAATSSGKWRAVVATDTCVCVGVYTCLRACVSVSVLCVCVCVINFNVNTWNNNCNFPNYCKVWNIARGQLMTLLRRQ